jgi:hypothetical protein
MGRGQIGEKAVRSSATTRGMATIRHKPGHIAASDSSRTSYKPAFLRGRGYTGVVWTTVHSIQVIENERRIEMRVEQVYRQSLQMAHFVANRCHIPSELPAGVPLDAQVPTLIHSPLLQGRP